MTEQRLILASASPQRRRLLEGLGVQFDVVPSSIEEAKCAVMDPAERAVCLAIEKAREVHGRHPDAWAIGCDTLVVCRGELLEKPEDAMQARHMLELQSGRESLVHSALCVVGPRGEMEQGLSTSVVRFKELTRGEVDWWMETGLWRDRSGAFQIDGPGQLLISRLDGDWTGVVGLPVFLLGELMRKLKAPYFR